jgi:hypothetical protein
VHGEGEDCIYDSVGKARGRETSKNVYVIILPAYNFKHNSFNVQFPLTLCLLTQIPLAPISFCPDRVAFARPYNIRTVCVRLLLPFRKEGIRVNAIW